MAEETSNISLSGNSVSKTYRGILHFPKGIDSSLSRQIVYDGAGIQTSLTLGGGQIGAAIDGALDVSGSLSVGNNVTLGGNLTIGGSINSNTNITFNDISILSSGSNVSIRTSKGIESGYYRIREYYGNYELYFGNPNNIATPNLFTIKVDSTSNNLYIKHDYDAADSESPFYINRSTGEVYIKKLKTDNIANNLLSNGKNSYRNVVQPGTVLMYATTAVPDGYLKCDGSKYVISQYNDLYTVIGQSHKTLTTIDTTTEFQVPLIQDFKNNSIIYVIKW